MQKKTNSFQLIARKWKNFRAKRNSKRFVFWGNLRQWFVTVRQKIPKKKHTPKTQGVLVNLQKWVVSQRKQQSASKFRFFEKIQSWVGFLWEKIPIKASKFQKHQENIIDKKKIWETKELPPVNDISSNKEHMTSTKEHFTKKYDKSSPNHFIGATKEHYIGDRRSLESTKEHFIGFRRKRTLYQKLKNYFR